MTTKKKDIRILRVTHLRGPNIWTYRPVIEAWLDIGALEETPSDQLPGLYQRLTGYLPGLIEHRCGVGERGGFLERLREGTWAGHILEHVVLELQNLAGMRTGFGQTRSTATVGVYKMAFRTREEQVGRAALEAGRALLMAAINDQAFDLASQVEALRELVDARCLGPSTANIVDAATDRKIPSLRLTDGNLVQLGHGAAQRRIWTAETDRTSAIAEGIASDKDLTKTLLKACGIPVPEGCIVRSAAEAWEEAQDIGLPVVIKPYDGNHGRGVSLNLMSEADVIAAYELAARKGDSKSVIVERFITGDEHRILVVGNKIVAVGRGESLWVSGDGSSNVTQLVDAQINTDPRRGSTEDFPLNAINPAVAAEVVLELKRQGMTADSVPLAAQKVLIQLNGNVAHDVTDDIHPDIAAAATLAARIIGLDIAGVDLVVEDISKPLTQQRGAIIEVNASPGLLAHIKPANGPGREVGKAIVDHLFAPQENARIAIVGVAGTRGTSLIARIVGALLHVDGKQTGVACQQGLYLNKRQVTAGPCADWEAGQRLLINRSVQAAVFETNARAILSDGLAYDKCSVGVVTDMAGFEELAEFHIHDAEQMLKIMRTQVDVVLPEGFAVLNGADAAVVELAPLCDGGVIFYALDGELPTLRAHRAAGGRVLFTRDSQIVLAEGEQETALLPLAVLKPSKVAQAESLLAAIAAAWALNISPELIAAGLRTFDSSYTASF
ncbi:MULTISPECIES: cyanophycin synthetase [unclassified Undibacterium]|uniref:cyanophycin synthetase n=1 Tax=unclassified Undibacterium TaxID=2630295 RepID=UPI002AC99E1A|nr:MULTISPECIES: cyanophycin synthetase [unclassified Undibacterium]MEB0141004.1 cyanophycin synthetase [Undibacterium sp. CCC2.1]MEB0171945.1 cyanophycin synthetase [Undibacterium sp. CCC1.1]MEB0177947.1 cyanophycin synthetase [Undibacterium sp. CCC3.4]MEB0217183.1 cyanophycin synthetase [Undibacterium sp. 5I2]WPX43558.1 cyanophycin synthetase [Undibacterium sp. CCC3.4]